ncbi:MAG TPA: hypothetical protein VMV49_03020 [Candidatus Deferrimicrobium sp.]|nr:hypothetical protein [Candidatus Deferrimicrobium sp.]
MEFIKGEVSIQNASKKLISLLTELIQRKEESIKEIIGTIDKENLYAEIGGKNKTNYINIGFFENYERNTTADLVAFCPQIKIQHKIKGNQIAIFFYKESHPILHKKVQYEIGENKIVKISTDELRYILDQAKGLTILKK